ncbi:MAG: hypothetical protein WC455_17275 [Dehalococcoidia bacterium]|jgi:hypothetical protein
MSRITRKLWDWVDGPAFSLSEKLWGRRTRNWHSLAFGLALIILWVVGCLVLAAASIVTLLIDGAWWCLCRVPAPPAPAPAEQVTIRRPRVRVPMNRRQNGNGNR